MEFYKQFLQANGSTGTRSAGISLAVFGKHPGWDDHIPDVGLSTESLSLLKRILYVRGIGGLIDSGAWEDVPEEDVLPGFDHTFVGQRGGDTLIGRMWASTDGKGRSKYPMVVVAHVVGLPVEKCLGPVLGLLEEFHVGCTAVETADEVLALLGSIQEEVNQLVGDLNPSGDLFIPSRRVLKRMVEGLPLSDPEQHRRLLYEIRNKLEPFSLENVDMVMSDDSHAGEHIRLPLSGFRDQVDGYLGWLSYFRTQVSPKVPILLVSPMDKPWMDAIVGLFTGLQLSCLRASLHHVPCVTDIEYNISEDFSEYVADLLTGIADWEESPTERSVFGAPAKRNLTQRVAQATSTVGHSLLSNLFQKLRKNRLLLISTIIGAVIVLIILILIFRGFGKSQLDTVDPENRTDETALHSEGTSEDLVDAWNYLSKADEWYPRFLRYARNTSVQKAWEVDSELARILDLMNSSGFFGLLDEVGTVSNIPPSELSSIDEARQGMMIELAMQVNGIESVLRNWTVRKQAESILNKARANGWDQISDEMNRILPPLRFNRDLGIQIQEQLAYTDVLQRTAGNLSQNEELVSQLLATGLTCFTGVDTLNTQTLDGVSSMAVLNDALIKENKVLQRLQEVVAGGAKTINEDLLLADTRYADESGTAYDRLDRLSQLLEDYQVMDAAGLPVFDAEAIFSRKQLTDQLASLKELEPGLDSVPLVQRWETAVEALSIAEEIPRVRANRRNILAKHNEALGLFDDLRVEIGKGLADRSDPSGWFANLPFLLSQSSPVMEQWKKRLETLVPLSELQNLATDRDLYIRRRQLVDDWLKVYQELDNFLEGISLHEIPDDSSRARQVRYDEIQNLYKSLATASVIELAEGLDRPFTSDQNGLDAFLEWQKVFMETFSNPIKSLEVELADLELALNGNGTGSFSDLVGLINAYWPNSDYPDAIRESYMAVEDLLFVSKTDSATELLAVFEKSPWTGVRWAVWRQLNGLNNWPGTLADLDTLRSLGQRMTTQGLNQIELDQSLRSFWRRAMLNSANRKQRLDLWSFLDTMELSTEDLPQSWQYDRLVCNIQRSSAPVIGHEEAVALRNSFLESVRDLKEVAAQDGVIQFLSDLEGMTFEQGRQIDQELLRQAGPGKVGWILTNSNPMGSYVQYSWPSQNLQDNEGFDGYILSFLLVESKTGERFYMSTNEISCGLFFDWVNERFGWDALMEYIPDGAFGSAQAQSDIEWRVGPRAWTLEDDKTLLVAMDWQLQPNTQGVPTLADIAENPSRFSPMNYITGPASRIWANSIGCRLPTPANFKLATSWPDVEMNSPNLRDSTWGKHLKYLQDELAGAFFTSWPDLDGFVPEGITFPQGDKAQPSSDLEDGILWFREVGIPDEIQDKILNLQGNVAEILYDSAVDQFFVAGASSLSPAEVVWDKPYSAQGISSIGSSDVGLRVAFDAPVPLPGRILIEAITAAPEWFAIDK